MLGDGDFLMGATALWTAVHYRIPLLVVVSNNNSFFNDELPRALRAAIDCVEAGGVAVVDVRVEPGYAPVNSAAVARGATA